MGFVFLEVEVGGTLVAFCPQAESTITIKQIRQLNTFIIIYNLHQHTVKGIVADVKGIRNYRS